MGVTGIGTSFSGSLGVLTNFPLSSWGGHRVELDCIQSGARCQEGISLFFSAPARALTPHLGDAAAADREIGAGDEGGEIAQEKGAAFADLLGAAVPPER